jgi:hypothetical protein
MGNGKKPGVFFYTYVIVYQRVTIIIPKNSMDLKTRWSPSSSGWTCNGYITIHGYHKCIYPKVFIWLFNKIAMEVLPIEIVDLPNLKMVDLSIAFC